MSLFASLLSSLPQRQSWEGWDKALHPCVSLHGALSPVAAGHWRGPGFCKVRKGSEKVWLLHSTSLEGGAQCQPQSAPRLIPEPGRQSSSCSRSGVPPLAQEGGSLRADALQRGRTGETVGAEDDF